MAAGNAPSVNSWQTDGDCPIRMRKGARVESPGSTSARVCSKVPTVSLETQPPSSISRFNYQRLAGPDSHFSAATGDLLPVSLGDNTAHLVKRSDLHQHILQLLSDNTELLFNMSSEPRLLLLSAPLCCSAHHMIR